MRLACACLLLICTLQCVVGAITSASTPEAESLTFESTHYADLSPSSAEPFHVLTDGSFSSFFGTNRHVVVLFTSKFRGIMPMIQTDWFLAIFANMQFYLGTDQLLGAIVYEEDAPKTFTKNFITNFPTWRLYFSNLAPITISDSDDTISMFGVAARIRKAYSYQLRATESDDPFSFEFGTDVGARIVALGFGSKFLRTVRVLHRQVSSSFVMDIVRLDESHGTYFAEMVASRQRNESEVRDSAIVTFEQLMLEYGGLETLRENRFLVAAIVGLTNVHIYSGPLTAQALTAWVGGISRFVPTLYEAFHKPRGGFKGLIMYVHDNYNKATVEEDTAYTASSLIPPQLYQLSAVAASHNWTSLVHSYSDIASFLGRLKIEQSSHDTISELHRELVELSCLAAPECPLPFVVLVPTDAFVPWIFSLAKSATVTAGVEVLLRSMTSSILPHWYNFESDIVQAVRQNVHLPFLSSVGKCQLWPEDLADFGAELCAFSSSLVVIGSHWSHSCKRARAVTEVVAQNLDMPFRFVDIDSLSVSHRVVLHSVPWILVCDSLYNSLPLLYTGDHYTNDITTFVESLQQASPLCRSTTLVSLSA